MRGSNRAIAGLSLLVIAACGGGYGSSGSNYVTNPTGTTGGTTTGTATSTSNAVGVSDNSFSPSATSVVAGSTVTWTWAGANTHNVTFDDGASSPTQRTGTYSRTFASAGTYSYHCTVHGAAMSGTVTVK